LPEASITTSATTKFIPPLVRDGRESDGPPGQPDVYLS
jgi:hypothetical protein